VYRARDSRLERTVAIKVLPQDVSSSAELRERFEREAKAISQISHPHICALYDVNREGETEYLVMELLEGGTLSARLTKGALPLEQALRYGIEIADALDMAHRQGVVLRDLKPANVMLTKSGVKLLDFGLAKALEVEGPVESFTSVPTVADVTREGTILGTFPYMAPEQLEGRKADPRTDIFALGATLYEMATGKKAFEGPSRASLISAILRDEPKSISQVDTMIPPELDRVVKTCLAKDPDDRWQTAHDVKLQLEWIAEGGSAVGLPAPVVARRKEPRAPGLGGGGRGHAGGARLGPAASRAPAPGAPHGAVLSPSSREVRLRVRRRADGAVARRPPPRVNRTDGRREESAVGAALERDGRSAARRHGRAELSLLVSRQPVSRILRWRQAQEDRRVWWASASPLRCPDGPWRNLES